MYKKNNHGKNRKEKKEKWMHGEGSSVMGSVQNKK